MQKRVHNILHHLVMLCLWCWLPASVCAQPAPPDNTTELKQYHALLGKHIKEAKVLLMCDTLFQRAKTVGNIQFQNTAWVEKIRHYYIVDDYKHMIQVKEQLKAMMNRTGYYIGYLNGTSIVVSYLIHKGEYQAATEMIGEHRAIAEKNNDPAYVGGTYRLIGVIHATQGLNNAAIKSYQEGIDYLNAHANPTESRVKQHLYNLNLNMVQSYLAIKEFEKVEKEVHHMLLLYTQANQQRNLHEILLRLAIHNKEWEKATFEKHKTDSLIRLAAIYDANERNYQNCLLSYWIHFDDKEQVKACYQRMRKMDYTLDNQFENAMKYYRYTQRYDTLSNVLNNYIKFLRDKKRQIDMKVYEERFKQLNNSPIMLERNRMELNNVLLQLQKANDEQKLQRMQLTRDSLTLQNHDLNLSREQAESRQQKSMIEKRREEAALMDLTYKTERERRNTLAVALAIFFALVLIYSWLHHKGSHELKRRKLQAEAMQQVAEKANKDKVQFLQDVSHEIRTPLNAIVGFNEVLNNPDYTVSEDERKEFLTLIQHNTQLLSRIINDVLNLSKLESGTYKLHLSQTTADALCRAALQSVASLSKKPHIELKYSADKDSSMPIQTDVTLVSQVLTHYLQNAYKYTAAGSITLENNRIEKEGETYIRFAVTDTGCGVNAQDVETIFNSFTKLDSFKQGSGIGLNICRYIGEALHGRAFLDATSKEGSRFCFDLPVNQPLAHE